MVVQTLRSIGGYVGAVAGAPVRMITPTRPLPRREYDETLRTLSEASVEMYFNAFKDVDWDAPEMALPEDDERWILPTLDLLGAHPWYQSLPKARQIEVGRHRLTAMVKT
ncbi:MAG TPA: diiron oxygenase, partial [Jiangellaceae bacterium]